jgi:hypothetical protein
MPFWSIGSSMRWVAAAVAGAFIVAGTDQASAACYNPQQQLPAQTISAFVADPSQLLQQYPNGGPQMISQIRDLAASDPATLWRILALSATANKEQKQAIGAGLGQAARICVRTDQAYANDIQQAIAQTKDQEIVLAYTGIAGDQPTGPVGAAGGAVGGQTNALFGGPTGTGAPQNIPGGSSPTFPFGVTGGVTGGGGTTTNTSVTTITVTVSP